MAEKSPSYPAVPQPGANAKPNLIAPQYGLPTGFRQMAYGSSDIYGKTYAMVRNSQVQVRRLQSTVTTQYRSGSPVPTAPRPTSNASTSIPYVTNVSATATSAAFGGAGFSKVVVSFSVPSDQRNWKYARVYVKNFQGNPNYVLQGEFTQAPATLMLQATGETIQISVGSRSPFGEVNDFTKAPGTAVTLTTGGGSSAVTSLDGVTGAVVLNAGNAISVTDNSPSAGDIKIASPTFVASGASHAPGSVPDPGATAGTTKFLREDATWAVPSGGSSPAATIATITTASLATNASESGSISVFKSFLLLKVQYSCKARVELYSTSTARDSDASRAWGTIPTLYAQNELISDTQESSGAATWIMSPAALGFNADTTRTTSIYYRVTNLDTTQAVTITLTVLELES